MNKTILTALLSSALCGTALADINVGVIVSTTGGSASLGIPEKNAVALLPKTIGGQKVNYIVLDDASDPGNAVTLAKKLIQENKVDIILGPSISTAAVAVIDTMAEAKVPNITFGPPASLVSPMDAKRAWIFKVVPNDSLLAQATASYMQRKGIKTVGFLGFNDVYGQGWLDAFTAAASTRGIKIVGAERFARTDTSVTGQALKLVAAKPDAMLVAASGVIATLPQRALRERGFTGTIFHVSGVANSAFLAAGGKDIEGIVLAAGPIVVANQLPDDLPSKKVDVALTSLYEAKYGAGSMNAFAGHAWDAGLLLQKAIPVALKKAKPGTPEFRSALRDALENTRNIIGVHGIFNMSPSDHNGMDQRARVMITVENGAWKYIGR